MKNNKLLKYLLIPFSWIYGLITSVRNKLFDLNILTEKEFNIPVISVGNITVGGTGKTPMVESLITLLKDDFRPGVLSRGYRRKSRGFIIAGSNPSWKMIGDEPCQIKRKFPEITVAVDTDRVRGIKKLMALYEDIDIIILDDAFQHRRVKPGLSILLMDFNRPVTKDRLLPLGRLRENPESKKRADIVIITKTPENADPIYVESLIKDLDLLPSQNLFFSTIVYEKIQNVFYPDILKNHVWENKNLTILLVCGIANPFELKKFVSLMSKDIRELYFSDHHDYTKRDIEKIEKLFNEISNPDKIIITTEKDSVRFKELNKIPEEIKKRMYYIPIKTSIIDKDKENFNSIIFNYVRINKRNSILH